MRLALSGDAARLLVGTAAFEVGTGMTMPLLIVYLHGPVGLSLSAAGGVLAVFAAAGFAASPVAGAAVDRVGARRVALAACGVGGCGTLAFVWVGGVWSAAAAAAAQGAGFAAGFVAVFPLLAHAVPADRRGELFGANYAATNLGLAVGGVAGGLAAGAHGGGIQRLFVVDAATYAAFAAVLLTVAGRPPAPAHGGYRAVLRDRSLLAATALSTLLAAAGYCQLTAGFPAWATGPVGSTPRVVGFGFAANTIVIVLVQLPVARALRGRSRPRAIAVACVIFAAAWLVVLSARSAGSPALAAAALVAGAAAFGVGETLVSPSLPVIVNDLAPPGLLGRYNATFGLSWQAGPVVGAPIAGAALDAGAGTALWIGLAAACAAGAPLVLALGRRLPGHVVRGPALG